jgi:Fumarylacetoacetate (FAA) hydrolase family
MATLSLAPLRRGADLTPAVGIGGWYWPLAAAGALGLAGLDTDVRSLFADWRAQFPRLQLFADECARGGAPTAAAIPAQCNRPRRPLPGRAPPCASATRSRLQPRPPDPHELQLTLPVNGKIKQNASTAGMIYCIDEHLSSISQFVMLWPTSSRRRRSAPTGAAN